LQTLLQTLCSCLAREAAFEDADSGRSCFEFQGGGLMQNGNFCLRMSFEVLSTVEAFGQTLQFLAQTVLPET
jgi:hypothetical protein